MNVIQTLLVFFVLYVILYLEYNLIVLDKWPVEAVKDLY